MPEPTIKDLIDRDRPRSQSERAAKAIALLAPFVVTTVLLALVWLLSSFAVVRALVGYGLFSFFVLGKFLILRGIAEGGFGPWELALLVFYLDIAVAFLLTFNLDYVYHFPYLGGRLEGLQEHGRELLSDRPWLRKVTFLGIVLFVMFPLTGTGAIGGSLFGRLLGLGRIRTWGGIVLGSAAGCFGMAALAKGVARAVPEAVRESAWFEATGLVLVVGVLLLLTLRARRIGRARRERRGGATGGSSNTEVRR